MVVKSKHTFFLLTAIIIICGTPSKQIRNNQEIGDYALGRGFKGVNFMMSTFAKATSFLW